VAALALIVVGIFPKPPNIGLALIGCGAVVLLVAVVMPTVSQVEFGFTSGLKVVGPVRDRAEELGKVFEEQRPVLEGCAKRMCDDPATAKELLTGAMARATGDWRGPTDREMIRTYVLCWFVHDLVADTRLAGMEQPATTAAKIPVSELIQRVIRVLGGFGAVPVEELADMVGLSSAEVQAELSRGKSLKDPDRREGV
jgi:hypothetical protein